MSTTIAVRTRRLLDGTGSPSLGNSIVLIENGTIADVGREGEVPVPRDTRVLTLPDDETLLPGLVDAHFHPSLCWYLTDYLLLMDDAPQKLFFRSLRNLRLCLRSGVTTVRCLAERAFVDLLCRRAVEEGLVAGPHMVTCTRGFRPERGHGFLGVPFANIGQLRNKFVENVEAGADFLKLFVTGTVLVDGQVQSFLSRDEVQAAVKAAHQLGRHVTVHAVGGQGLHDCLDAGVDCVEHGYFADDEALAKMRERGVPMVVTSGVFFDDEAQEHLHDETMRRALREQGPIVRERLTAAIEAGVDIAVGTDGMVGKLAEEVRFLTGIGMSVEKAVAAATRRGAEVAGLGETTGTIEPGKRADLISVVGDPLRDPSALSGVGLVIKAGKRLDTLLTELDALEKGETLGADVYA